MMSDDQFKAEVERFIKAAGISATKFGREAIGDPNLVRDLRAGRSPSLKTVERVLDCIRRNDVAIHSPTTNSEVAA